MFNGGAEVEPGGLVQTTLLSNDHHPLLIEFEPDQTQRPGMSGGGGVPRFESSPGQTNQNGFNPEQFERLVARTTSSGRLLETNTTSSGRLLDNHTTSPSRVLETHFDEPYTHSTNQRSNSQTNLVSPDPSALVVNTSLNSSLNTSLNSSLNSPFPGPEAPYISSSVTLPAKEELGFYQNVSGRFRQQPGVYRTREEQRASFARQAELHKSPKTQELEEFAAKFEGYQKQRSRRNLQPTPMLDQLARENQATFWLNNPEHQLSPLETNLLKLVQRTDSVQRNDGLQRTDSFQRNDVLQRTDSINRRTHISDDSSSGRESVTTVISTCSNETLKYSDTCSNETLKYSDRQDHETLTLKYSDRTADRHSSSETLRYSEMGEEETALPPWRKMGEDESPLPPTFDPAVTHPCDRFLADTHLYGNYINVRNHQDFPATESRMSQDFPTMESKMSQDYPAKESRINYDGSATTERWRNDNMAATTPEAWQNDPDVTSRRVLSRSLSESASRKLDVSDGLGQMVGGSGHGEAGQTTNDERMHCEPWRSNLEPRRTSLGHSRSQANLRRGESGGTRPEEGSRLEAKEAGGACSFCNLGHHSSVPCPAKYPTQYVEGKSTFPRGSTRRKPKLPTPPSSPNISSLGRTTPSPPPPPLTDIDLVTSSEPLPPPPPIVAKQRPNHLKYATPITGRQPVISGSSQPATSPSQSLAGGRQPATSPSQSLSVGRQPATSPSQSLSGGRQPATSPTQSLTGGRQPATSPIQSLSGGRQPATSPTQSLSHLTGRQPATAISHTLPGRPQPTTPQNPPLSGRQPASTPAASIPGGRQAANTPKRDSPATIAAKEAPGWQMFLGVKSSTVSFTSEEVDKLRAARDNSRTRTLRRDDWINRDSTRGPRDDRGHKDDRNPREDRGPKDDRSPRDDRGLKDNRSSRDPEERQTDIDERVGRRVMGFNRWDERSRDGPFKPNGSIQPNGPFKPSSHNQFNGHNQSTGPFNPAAKAQPTGGLEPERAPSRREESSSRLRRTESRGRKRSENPNRVNGDETENIDPSQKRQSVEDRADTAAAASRTNSQKLRKSGVVSKEAREEEGETPGPNNNKQQTLHLSRERSLKSISNWWKSSLESGPSPPTPGPASPDWTETGGSNNNVSSPKHNHSHSDSGISSLSGRSSCMSPMSDLSSSSGSSRTSLRSSSIVSASNIPLEEEAEGEEVDFEDLCRDLAVYSPQDSRIFNAIKLSLVPRLSVYFPEGSLEFEIRSNSKENSSNEVDNPRRNHSSNFEESRRKLLKFAGQRIETQRKHQQLLKESMKTNEHIGTEVILALRQVVAHQPEMDKVKLFIDEVDKITSLVIGLSSRLLRLNLNHTRDNTNDKQLFVEKKAKLEEQLEEARKLRQSIFRRAHVVFNTLNKYLPKTAVHGFGGFIKEKIRLILEIRQQAETLKNEEDLLKCLKEYSTGGVMVI